MASIFNEKVDFSEKVKKKIDSVDVVSFDIFDTLIKRNCKTPHGFLKVMEKEVLMKYGVNNFSAIRVQVEQVIYKKRNYVTLADIYSNLNLDVSEDELNQIRCLEEEYELNYCTANLPLKELFEYCISKDKKIIAISDMYLSKLQITKMLNKCGYNLEHIFISCESKAGKRSGKLFKKVIDELGIDVDRVLHIGDSLKADFLGAKKASVEAIKIPNNIKLFNDRRFINKINDQSTYSFYKAYINNHIYEYRSSYYKAFGFSEVGPLVFNYANWLLKSCLENNIEDIFFFSRDGDVLKRAFDIINRTSIKSHYIYFSRRALRMPFFYAHNDFETVIDNLPHTRLLTVKSFVEKLGLDAEECKDLVENSGLNMNTEVLYSELKQDKFRNLFNILRPKIEKKSFHEYNLLREYLIQENFVGKIGIVDIGWHNSMQYYLEQLDLQKELGYELYGFYVGVQPNAQKLKHATGFISDTNDGKNVESVLSYIGLIESFFLAQEGSTETYYKNREGIITPLLLDYEYDTKDFEYNAIKDLQSGIFEFVEGFNCLRGSENLELSGYDSFCAIKEYGINPYLYDVRKFATFRYYSEGISYLAASKEVVSYLGNPLKLKKDLLDSRWKIGFMKNVFKIQLPYYFIYKQLRG